MRILLLIALTFLINLVNAASYHFSTIGGDDTRTPAQAQNSATPWKSLDKLNAVINTLKAGDSVLLKRNEVFKGFVIVGKSGEPNAPIVFSAYGTGNKPVIDGMATLSGWTSAGNGIWEANCPANSMVNMVLVDGLIKEIGRYPNRNTANNGYLNYESFIANTQITDNQLSASPNWTGGNVVIRKNRWVLDKNLITSHAGNTIKYNSESGYPGSINYGYFIQNHPQTLDVAGEWYFKPNEKRLGFYFPSGNPSSLNVEAAVADVLVSINNQSNIVFDGISFRGANQHAFNLGSARHIIVRNCDIAYSGINAVKGGGLNDFVIENSTIIYTNNTALDLSGCSYVIARNNSIRNTGIFPGMGKGDSGSYEAILIDGDNELIEGNEISNTGYNPITFRGNLNIIRNNVITDFTMVKDDGGGIYTWNNIANAPPTYGSKIIGNIVINGKGAGNGTDDTAYAASSGIYMDDNTAGVEITGNTVANCGLHGVYVHNGHEISMGQNTLFNNQSQLVLAHDNYAAYSPVRNMKVNDNIFFAKDNYSLLAEFKTSNNDIADFGTFEGNYYCRPGFDSYTISASYVANGATLNKTVGLDAWKAMFGKDATSKKSPVNVPSFDYILFEYNPSAIAKTMAINGNYVDVKNNSYSGSVTIAPYASVILLKQQAASSLCTGTGSLVREQWDNVPGNSLASVSVANTPSNTTQLGGAFESGNAGDDYSARIRGFICPPQTGNYAFWIAGDDAADLWLSTDENPANKTRIAYVSTWTYLRQWNKNSSQKSRQITLQAGRRYYVEVLQKQGNGGSHVSVAWQLPDGTFEGPIAATHLLPTNTVIVKTDQTIAFSPLSNVTYGDPPFTLAATASSGLAVSFRIVSGPATLTANQLLISDTGTVVVEATQAGNTLYNAAPAVSQSFNVLSSVNTPTCSATGTILREQWINVTGNNIPDIPWQTTPSVTSQLTLFESPANTANRYASRIRGYICPPYNGYYTFSIAADDAGELWLSTDDNAANKIRIAYVLSWTLPREWNKYASQKSALVYLRADQRYYLEALHKEGEGEDNLAVAWQLPGGVFEGPIPGSRLSPYAASGTKDNQVINFIQPANIALGDPAFALTALASSGLPVAFRIISGPATLSGNLVSGTAAGTVVVEASQAGNSNYNAANPVTRTFYITSLSPAPTCAATGTILREQWNDIAGNNTSDFSFSGPAGSASQLTLFEAPSGVADNYASRIRGYICAPQSGSYTFLIAGDDAAELWLSTDDDPANKIKIAFVPGWTNIREWNKYPSQKSVQVILDAGKRYYIEALHKDGGGGDNLAVAWQLPDQTLEAPIAGSRLSPYVPVVVLDCAGAGSILREQWNDVRGNNVDYATFQNAPNSSAQLSLFEGPLNFSDNYASRMRGYVCPPQSGNYTFYLSGDDAAELWLSTSDDPANKIKIAYLLSWTNSREWNRYSSQKSALVNLRKGQLYYIEALHKEAEGGDHLAVAWQLPDNTTEAPIPGNRLVPFQASSSNREAGKTAASGKEVPVSDIPEEEVNLNLEINAYPDPFTNYATVYLNPGKSGMASLDVFDMNGRHVLQLFNGMLEHGRSHLFTLKANGLANGMYIIRYATKNRVLSRKITLIHQGQAY